MTANRFAEAMLHKRVQLRFDKQTLHLHLSHALFSGHQVDAGSQLLLSTLPKHVPLDDVSRVLDLGSGVGTLGLAIASRASQAAVTLRDRDAYAVWASAYNAHHNALDNVTCELGLGMRAEEAQRYDLIVSNVPAKAGEPVLRRWPIQMLTALAGGGRAAVVVVRPLAAAAATWIAEAGGTLLHSVRSANHTVYHFTGQPDAADNGRLASLPPEYIRGRMRFPGPVREYELDTVYGLGEFDQLHFSTVVLFELLQTVSLSGSVVLIGDGVGHLPAAAGQRASGESSIMLCSRDLLALEACAHNIPDLEHAAIPTIVHATEQVEPQTVDWLVIVDQPVPDSPWNDMVTELLHTTLAPRGKAIVVSRSSALGRLLPKLSKSMSVIGDRKQAGFRGVILRRRALT